MDAHSPFRLRLRLTKIAGDRSRCRGRGARREFHIARLVREKYGFNEGLYSSSGNVIFPDLHAVRLFAQKINAAQDLVQYPERAVQAGQINAMALIDEILHYVVHLYQEQTGVRVFKEANERLVRALGDELDATLERFVAKFPPLAVHRNELSPGAYLAAATGGIANREVILEELLLLWIANVNPAFSPFRELFDDTDLAQQTAYLKIVAELGDYFRGKPPFGPDNENLVDMLHSPAIAVPHSLSGQLGYIRDRWGMLLGRFLLRLLSSLDLVREEQARIGWGAPGPAPQEAIAYGGADLEHERFSPDREWMPRVVLMAKSALVWLDQLSKRYGRSITRLSEIPDEELDRLSAQGFTGLWLIGLWQRSKASRRIKQLCGNPEAEASAYSLDSYAIAQELGGWDALSSLRERCWRRGIRLASDMVPNHTGIDSTWVIEHPERFIQTSEPPFPSYSYGEENLSPVPGIGIFLEDHYFTKSDAAVTFKRVDFVTGEARYIYHGNDGTHTPWNDTAQLNFLDPAVREAVIQTILHVARNFPIIRFDAAMTLAKRHIQRLWYPEPGAGGAIPSRSEYGVAKADFENALPIEFWREVVDRVASEVPDTLLLAEAFWMMEGYFVRTLGMHRVYNSAFMNMLKTEDNASYRATIKNTLEFDPDILKRFVNFMNNPDEETAIAQFGKGDKYIGVCTMMVTMPGLPMFGHGQIEGFAEKYGMEYRRAYRQEVPDDDLVRRHEREIFPLMKERHLFAEVGSFRLYDFHVSEQTVDENVFAYSNRCGEESVLVVYNNRLERTAGRINRSVPYALKEPGNAKRKIDTTLAAALGLHAEGERYAIFRDQRSGLSFLRSSRELCERGLYIELSGYQTQVFLRILEIQDDEQHHYARLAARLEGRGVPDVDAALKEIFLEPVHLASFLTRLAGASEAKEDESQLAGLAAAYREFLRVGSDFSGGQFREEIIGRMERGVRAVRDVVALASGPLPELESYASYLGVGLQLNRYAPHLLLCVALLQPIGAIVPGELAARSRSLIDEWSLGSLCETALREVGAPRSLLFRLVQLVKILVRQRGWLRQDDPTESALSAMTRLLADSETQGYLGVNRHEEVLWFNREAYIDFVWWISASAAVGAFEAADGAEERKTAIERIFRIVQDWLRVLDESEYKVDKLVAALQPLRESKGSRVAGAKGASPRKRGTSAPRSGAH